MQISVYTETVFDVTGSEPKLDKRVVQYGWVTDEPMDGSADDRPDGQTDERTNGLTDKLDLFARNLEVKNL